ncbi:alkaline phosphatase D family protein [Baaleninema simplex]|uniref:alkaline phosphatase D family protein n=1 Tax=Baaleninema simplex TaxID=2862350 RepID=UPI000347C25A|nr:alkaline phosphatase D family protein [Baaleninema simplex]
MTLIDFLKLYDRERDYLSDLRQQGQGTATLPNQFASGDTTQTSSVLWARSTSSEEDLDSRNTFVAFEYSWDPDFNIVNTASGTLDTSDVPVKVEVSNLQPDTQYYVRVTDGVGSSTVGTFRTPADVGTQTGLRFGVAPDWQGELNPYPAIRNADDRDLEFFVLLGDTIYADTRSPAVEKPQAETLEEFRLKYDEVYSDRFGLNAWGDLRSSTSVFATIDDHEITNDVPGGAPPSVEASFEGDPATFINDAQLYETGMQAFQEYNPIRDEFYGDTGDPVTANERKLYRFQTYGSDAAIFVPDTRSFRDEPLPFLPDTASPEAAAEFLQASFDPDKTMLGAVQLEELKTDLLAAENSGITWKFVMSSVPIQNFGTTVAGERWEGYAAERTEFLKFIEDNQIDNVVFVSGDFHGNVVNNVTYQNGFGQPQIPTDVIDIMTGPVAYQLNLGNGPFGAPFGAATVAFTPTAILPQAQKDRYGTLSRAEKDAFIEDVVNARLVKFGYDTFGLEGSGIDATLLQGTYSQSHVFTWTEFDIDPATQALTVTSYGVEPYSQADIEANPEAILALQPDVTMQFVVGAKNRITGTEEAETLVGNGLNDEMRGLGGNDRLLGNAGNDTLLGGGGSDFLDGGDGVDTASYAESSVGVNADLKSEVVIQGFDPNAPRDADPDTFSSVENLVGSAFDDTLTGTGGDNEIEGGLGEDVLTGSGGSDRFVFRSPSEGGDRITDFAADDRLLVAATGFGGGLGAGIPLDYSDPVGVFDSTGTFVSGASPVPNQPVATFLYDVTTGTLSYDIDGTGVAGAVAIATLENIPTLTRSQIAVVT